MRIGDLHDLITIQNATESRDAFGAVIQIWMDYTQVWANVAPMRYTTGLEAVVSTLGREQVTPAYTITIRFLSGVNEQQRILWDGKELDIRRVIDPSGRREWLEMACEVVA